MGNTVAIALNNEYTDSDKARRKMLQDELKTLQAIERITLQRIRAIQCDLASMERAQTERDCNRLMECVA